MCGEKYDRAWCADMKEGSPPRMRGKGYIQNLKGRGLRITPAYAGKSQIASNPRRSGRDHPRVCGEKQ